MGKLKCGSCRFENRYSSILKYSCALLDKTVEDCQKYEPKRTCTECIHLVDAGDGWIYECTAPIPSWVYSVCDFIISRQLCKDCTLADRCTLFQPAEKS